MKAGAKAPRSRSARKAKSVTIVASAREEELQRRIVSALAEGEMRVAAQVKEPADVVELAPDSATIVVLACNVDEAREMAALRRLRRESRQPAVVVISSPATGTGVRRALDAGADALVFEPELELALATTVHAVALGQSVVPRQFRASVERPVLSHRENQVLALVRSGLTNAEIAERLYLAESTIKSHLSSIFTKFGVRSRKEVAAAFADSQAGSDRVIAMSKTGDPPERTTA